MSEQQRTLDLYLGIKDVGLLSESVEYGPDPDKEFIDAQIWQHKWSRQRYSMVRITLPYEVIKNYNDG